MLLRLLWIVPTAVPIGSIEHTFVKVKPVPAYVLRKSGQSVGINSAVWQRRRRPARVAWRGSAGYTLLVFSHARLPHHQFGVSVAAGGMGDGDNGGALD